MVPRCATPYSYIGGCTLNIRDYLANTFIVEENIFFAIYTVVIKGRLYKQLAKYLQRAKQLFEFKFKKIMTPLYCTAETLPVSFIIELIRISLNLYFYGLCQSVSVSDTVSRVRIELPYPHRVLCVAREVHLSLGVCEVVY